MHVPFQVNVPIDMATDLRSKLDRLKKLHDDETAQTEKKLKATGDIRIVSKLADIHARGKRLTVHNMVRLALTHGLANLVKKTDEQILSMLAEEGVTRGRPRAAI